MQMKNHNTIKQLNLEDEAMYILTQQATSSDTHINEELILQIYRDAIILNDKFDVKADAQNTLSKKINKLIVEHSNVISGE
jgi:hypothetical protein